MEYLVDEQGKWLKLSEKSKVLIEPNENYLAQRELERLQQEEEEANRLLTDEEVLRDYVLDIDFRLIMMETGL